MAKILYLEDDGMTRNGLVMNFGDDFEIEAHASPTEVPDNIDRSKPSYDLILTDKSMPGESGIEFARRVREAGGTLPIILLSGEGFQSIRDANPGFDDLNIEYVQKGLRSEVLLKKIDSQLHRRAKGDFGQSH